MYKRIELHNHTVESDGDMTVEELLQCFYGLNIRRFSLTDHNTISGHKKLQELTEKSRLPLEYITGYELTSYYGHILCQNISSYIPWEDIDKENADILFKRVHDAGGLVGIAHPFSIGSPVSNGMQFQMKIHDYSLLDFIEVINNAHPMIPDNYRAILWWEDLIRKGNKVAAVSGMDFHKLRDMSNYYTTYMEVREDSKNILLSEQFEQAIANCKTCITKGPIINCRMENNLLTIKLYYVEDGFSNKYKQTEQMYIKILTPSKEMIIPIEDENSIYIRDLQSKSSSVIIIELYEKAIERQNLLAIGSPIFLTKQFA